MAGAFVLFALDRRLDHCLYVAFYERGGWPGGVCIEAEQKISLRSILHYALTFCRAHLRCTSFVLGICVTSFEVPEGLGSRHAIAVAVIPKHRMVREPDLRFLNHKSDDSMATRRISFINHRIIILHYTLASNARAWYTATPLLI